MKAHSKHCITSLVLLLGLSTALVACGDEDPDEKNNLTQNNDTSEREQVDCVAACTDLGACGAALDVSCLSGFQQTCVAQCEQDASVVGLSQVSCATAAPFADGAVALEGTCAQVNACMPAPSDYSPGATDTWDACISDSGKYERFEPSISSAGRVAGFEDIADLLWRKNTAPSDADFLAAREIYAAGEGLDSRVQRREDEHYPPVMENGETLRCRDEGVPAKDPNRCVGPAQIRPIINDAFSAGIKGEDPWVNAAKIEAALTWFLYVSTHKEAVTCTVTKKDCDSAYAYYTGDKPRAEGIGLAGIFRRQVPQAHERVWDGLLAVRCWRDLDGGEEATDLTLRDRAVDQMDKALLYGLYQLVGQRTAQALAYQSDQRRAALAWLEIMAPVLELSASEIDASTSIALQADFKSYTGAKAQAETILGGLDEFYTCP